MEHSQQPGEIDLSVVLVTKNEESHIAACIESALKETEGLRAEIILVDSASDDRTVEIASRYNTTIIQLDRRNLLSPSAGRFVGTRHARGRFILFLDGDMQLLPGWLSEGLS